jgi:hypothetical protein
MGNLAHARTRATLSGIVDSTVHARPISPNYTFRHRQGAQTADTPKRREMQAPTVELCTVNRELPTANRQLPTA